MIQITQFIATFFCMIFTGAAVYISFVEHPARLSCGIKIAATEFIPSYRRATIMQASLALLSGILSLSAWLLGGSFWWLIGGIVIFSVIPFTLIIIMPTNNKLISPSLNQSESETKKLLDRWGRLHAVRSVLSIFASCIFLYLLIYS